MEQVHLRMPYNHYVSIVRPFGLYYNLARHLGTARLSLCEYFHPWSVSKNVHHGSYTLLSVDLMIINMTFLDSKGRQFETQRRHLVCLQLVQPTTRDD